MEYTDIIFLISILGFLAVFLYRLYHLFNSGRIYSIQLSIVMLIGQCILFAMGLFINITNTADILMPVLFRFVAALFVLNIAAFIMELFLNAANQQAQGGMQPLGPR